MRKFTAALAAVLMLGGCSAGVPEETEVTAAAENAEISEAAETEKFPRVIPANELYDVYPVKIIPPQNSVVKVNAETENIEEELYNSAGALIGIFRANYPVISGYSEEVCEKINAEIKKYADNILKENREDKFGRGIEENGEMNEVAREFYETSADRPIILFSGNSVGDNFFSVNFLYYPNGAGTVHECAEPTPMIFDLRTGERVDLENLLADRDGFIQAMENAFKQIVIVEDNDISADGYEKAMGEAVKIHEYFGENYGDFYGGRLFERISVKDGCVGFYYTVGDFGIGYSEDEAYFAGIPFSEAERYLNGEGKELFAGYQSAETEPANVIEYKGRRYFDTAMRIPYGAVDKDDLTEGDREFISLFENARNAEYYLGEE